MRRAGRRGTPFGANHCAPVDVPLRAPLDVRRRGLPLRTGGEPSRSTAPRGLRHVPRNLPGGARTPSIGASDVRARICLCIACHGSIWADESDRRGEWRQSSRSKPIGARGHRSVFRLGGCRRLFGTYQVPCGASRVVRAWGGSYRPKDAHSKEYAAAPLPTLNPSAVALILNDDTKGALRTAAESGHIDSRLSCDGWPLKPRHNRRRCRPCQPARPVKLGEMARTAVLSAMLSSEQVSCRCLTRSSLI